MVSFVDLVGDGRDGDHRIAVPAVDRRGRDVESSPVWRDDEIDLVLFRQSLSKLDVLAGIGLVVILDDFDHHLLVADLEATAGIDLLDPEFDVWPLGDCRATGQRTGLGRDRSELDHVLRLCRHTHHHRSDKRGSGQYSIH